MDILAGFLDFGRSMQIRGHKRVSKRLLAVFRACQQYVAHMGEVGVFPPSEFLPETVVHRRTGRRQCFWRAREHADKDVPMDKRRACDSRRTARPTQLTVPTVPHI